VYLQGRIRRSFAPRRITSYPLKNLKEEVAYIAYHFHWSRDEIFDMTHKERRDWAKNISKINEQINKGD
jgi:hypothetical protein